MMVHRPTMVHRLTMRSAICVFQNRAWGIIIIIIIETTGPLRHSPRQARARGIACWAHKACGMSVCVQVRVCASPCLCKSVCVRVCARYIHIHVDFLFSSCVSSKWQFYECTNINNKSTMHLLGAIPRVVDDVGAFAP